MLHRLMLLAEVARVEARRHRLDALALPRQHQACGVGTERLGAIRVAHDLGE